MIIADSLQLSELQKKNPEKDLKKIYDTHFEEANKIASDDDLDVFVYSIQLNENLRYVNPVLEQKRKELEEEEAKWHINEYGEPTKITKGDGTIIKPGTTEKRKERRKAKAEEKKEEKETELTPYFYDSNRIWWLWDEKNFCWKMSDEVDILNMYELKTNDNIISSKNRQEILNRLKQNGRKNKPLPIPKSWVQFKDSVVDILTGEKLISIPKYFITNPLPYKLGESEETPTIDKLFREWVICEGIQDESYVQTLYEIVAYSCCQEQFLQMMVALTGSGSNGKGTFLNLIAKFIGENNICSSNLRTLSTRFETSALYRKLVCFFGEVDSYDLSNTNLIKSLTGEDLIRYEFKGKTTFSEYSPTTSIIASNSLPITPDKSIGFYRRWLIIDFPNQFKVKRNLLKEIPESEFENLGLKVVSILKGLIDKNEFTNAGTFEQRRERYEQRSHPLIAFINETCEEGDGIIRLREFGNKFNQCLKDKRLRPYTINKIGRMLREEGYEIGSRHIGDDKTDSAKSILNLRWNLGYIEKNGSLSSSDTKKSEKELPKLPNSGIYHFNQDKPLVIKYEKIGTSELNFEDSGI